MLEFVQGPEVKVGGACDLFFRNQCVYQLLECKTVVAISRRHFICVQRIPWIGIFFMSGKEAKDWGLVDEVITKRPITT